MYNRDLPWESLSRPLALLSGLVIASLLFLTIFLVEQFDAVAQAREETVVAEGVQSRFQEISASVQPVVIWDDAVRFLDNDLDRRWATDNLGVYLAETGGFDGVLVMNRSDQPVFAARGGRITAPAEFASFTPGIRSLIAAVRSAELKRGPLPVDRPSEGFLRASIQASGVVVINQQAFLVVATLVTPDFGRYRPLHDRAPIVIATMPIDQAFLRSIARRFLLRAADMEAGEVKAGPGHGRIILEDFRNQPALTIRWMPQRPGQALFKWLGPPILAIVALLFAVLLFAYRRSRALAESLVASEVRATHMALHDDLTALPNRVLFLDRLQHALASLDRYGGSVVVHCIDLDKFKEVNDTLGHLVGDELLRAAAERMAAQCRASDTFARLSGDEFAILQIDASEFDAACLASRICGVMAEPFELDSARVFSGCSIGITRTESAGLGPVELLRQADLALYRAKAEERGSFSQFEPAMDATLKTRRALEADLREAIRADQLRLCYQPQVDGSGVMTGVEALVRWTDAARGEVSPGLFVPIAEESGLIMPLGMFTLRRAFEDSRRWTGLRVSINISASQLQSNSFVEELAALVAECDVDPTGFELEITEGVLLGDEHGMLQKLEAIRKMGFALVLDDFGTGFSSLSYLRKYPIDKIKIDRTFVANLGAETEPQELVLAIVRLARALNLGIIAEGVENLAQWTWLRSIGCPDSQGFFFRPAVTAAELDLLWNADGRSLWAPARESKMCSSGPVAPIVRLTSAASPVRNRAGARAYSR